MVRVEPVASKEDGKLGLSVQFEKSYLDQAAADIEDVAEQPELPSEDGQEAENPNDPRARGSRGAAMSPFVQPVTQPLPPSIATITAQGNLVLPAGEVGVLSEMAKQKGDVFEEVVILVQWN